MFLDIHVELAPPLFFAYLTSLEFRFFISNTNPIMKWKVTPNIKMGCITNCTIGFVPIKCDSSLKVLSLNTEVKFMMKCCNKNMIRNSAESAMANFLPMLPEKSCLLIYLGLNGIWSKVVSDCLLDNLQYYFDWF